MQKGTASLFIILAALVLVGLIAIFAFGVMKSPFSELPLKVPILPPAFITYTNRNLGFEFQYLNRNLTVKEDSEEAYNKRGDGDFRKNFTGYVGYAPGKFIGAISVLDETKSFDNSPFTVWVFDNPQHLTGTKWFAKYWYYPFLWGIFAEPGKSHVRPVSIATVSGQVTKYAIVSYQPGSPKYIYLPTNTKMFLIRILTAKDSGDKILSSFKLL